MSVPPSERNKVRLVFVVSGKHNKALPSDFLDALRMDVESGGETWPIEIQRTGEVIYPVIPEDRVDGAMIVANVPKGTLVLSLRVRIVPPEEPMTLHYLNDAAQQARGGWKRASGGIAAMTVPKFTCAHFGFSSPKVVSISQNGQQIWISPSAKSIQVPLSITGASGDAEVRWNRAPDDRISGCRLE